MRFIQNLLGTVCAICATVTLMSVVLRVDYGILERSARPWSLWLDVTFVVLPTLGAALFFTTADRGR